MEEKELLYEIGLSTKEANVYLASLTMGPSSILKLSEKTKIHRPALYKILYDLENKGIFKTTISGKRKLYFAVSPKQLLEYIKNKEELLKNALPGLDAMVSLSQRKPKILYFEGQSQIKDLFRTGLEAKSKEMYSFFPSKFMIKLFGKKEMVKIMAKRAAKGIKVKTLRSSQSEEEFDDSNLTTELLREVRYIPDARTFEMGVVIFDNKVNLFSPIEENFGIQIESESFSKLMKYFFNILWISSKESFSPSSL
jgi:sugar-specific transcriptional regulator TrmB